MLLRKINFVLKRPIYLHLSSLERTSLSVTSVSEKIQLIQPTCPLHFQVRHFGSGNVERYTRSVEHAKNLGNQVPVKFLGRSSPPYRPVTTVSWKTQLFQPTCIWDFQIRHFSSSNVEKAIKKLEDQKSQTNQEPAKSPSDPVPKLSLTQRFVKELKHYYDGFRLFTVELKISYRLIRKMLRGHFITRRERKQLVRTTADMFRMVPFLIIVLIPFLELLLPVFVMLFPNMLPSTFKNETKEAEMRRKKLKVKLEMAKFLQNTLEESAAVTKLKNNSGGNSSVEEFVDFMKTIRTNAQMPETSEILKFSKLFEDDLTMDWLNRDQLVAICRLLDMSTIITSKATVPLLRFRLGLKLRMLKADDKMIQMEGVESLTASELASACRARGMRVVGLSEQRLLKQLEQWLDLHLNHSVPASLMLLSSALYLPQNLPVEEKLKKTILSLDEDTEDDVKLRIAEESGERISNTDRLEAVLNEEEAIRDDQSETKTVETSVGDMDEKEPTVEVECQDLETIENLLIHAAERRHLSLSARELKELEDGVSEYQQNMEELQRQSDLKKVTLSESRVSKLLRGRLVKMIDRISTTTPTSECEDLKKQQLVSVEEILDNLNDSDDSKRRLRTILGIIDDDRDGKIDVERILRVFEAIGNPDFTLSSDQLADMIRLLKREHELKEKEDDL